jgi:hypothetical protein
VTYGGDSGNRIFVLHWRCSLIRVSVIRGSTVFKLPTPFIISITYFSLCNTNYTLKNCGNFKIYEMKTLLTQYIGLNDNIKMDLREVGWGDIDWINLAQDRDMWRVLVNAVMNLRVT